MNHQTALVRNKNIDIMRAFAILLVMIVHFPRFRQLIPFLNPWSGVDLFFAISGYVVANNFVPKLDLAVRGAKSNADKVIIFVLHAKAFFIRRFMRITPALVFALAFYMSLGFATHDPAIGSFSSLLPEIFSIFTYSANFYAGYNGATVLGWHWSLASEEQFYFLFPFFIFSCGTWRKRAIVTILGLFLITFVFRPFGTNWFGAAPAMMYLPQFRNDAIGYGFLLFIASQQSWFNQLHPRALFENKFWQPFIILVLIMIIAFAPQLALSFNFAMPIIAITSGVVLYIAVVSQRNFFEFLGMSVVLRWIGLRSYGIYLLHIPIVRLSQHIESLFLPSDQHLGYLAHFAIVITSLVTVTEVQYRLIEIPTMKLGKRWSDEIINSIKTS